ncbi:MAG: hypothetical protein RR959_06080 [Erysipelotrichaceae bacterium]
MNQVNSLLKINPSNLTEDIFTNTQTLVVPTGLHYMSEVLEDLPKGVFIDKQVCGVGGTTLAIKSNTNYVIAVHRKLLVENKHIQHPDILVKVLGGVKVDDIISQVKSGKNKIITTYDGLKKVSEALGSLGVLNQFHLLVDEVQNVIREGGDFRDEVCNYLLDNSCNFASVSYLTATSTERKYLPEQIRDIPYLKIEWEDSVNIKVNQKHIKGDLTQAITAIALEHLDDSDRGEAYFFFNSVRGILPVIKNLIKLRTVTEKDIKIICADSEDNEKLLNSLGGVWKPERPLEQDKDGNLVVNNKTITFITKTCFEGVDYYSDNPVTYIVSDARNKEKHFVKTDIAIDIRQIAGRFRTSNPMSKQEVVLLWTGQYEGFGMSEQEYEEFVLQEIEKAKNTINLVNSGQIHSTLEQLAKTSKYYTERDGVVCLNNLAYSNIMSEYRTQYEDFKVVVDGGKEIKALDNRLNKLYDVDNYDIPKLSPLDKTSLGKKLNFAEVSYDLYNLLSLGVDNEEVRNIYLACPRLKEYVDELGFDILKTLGYQESKIKVKFNESIGAKETSLRLKDVQDCLNFSIGDKYTSKQLKDLFSECFKSLSINKTSKASCVLDYYSVGRANINGCRGYKILGKLS